MEGEKRPQLCPSQPSRGLVVTLTGQVALGDNSTLRGSLEQHQMNPLLPTPISISSRGDEQKVLSPQSANPTTSNRRCAARHKTGCGCTNEIKPRPPSLGGGKRKTAREGCCVVQSISVEDTRKLTRQKWLMVLIYPRKF